MTAAERDQRRNAADAVARGQCRRFFGVDFGETQARVELPRRLRENRRHHFARATLRGPEIHHHGQIVLFDMSLDVAFVQNNRLGVKQRSMATAALRAGRRAGPAERG